MDIIETFSNNCDDFCLVFFFLARLQDSINDKREKSTQKKITRPTTMGDLMSALVPSVVVVYFFVCSANSTDHFSMSGSLKTV
jgi:hypothetical protein